jgi:hypothetical protein
VVYWIDLTAFISLLHLCTPTFAIYNKLPAGHDNS